MRPIFSFTLKLFMFMQVLHTNTPIFISRPGDQMAALLCFNPASAHRRTRILSDKRCLRSSSLQKLNSSLHSHQSSWCSVSPFRRKVSVKPVCCSGPPSIGTNFMENKGLHCTGFGERHYRDNSSYVFLCMRALATPRGRTPQNVDLPPILPKRKKKPFLTPPKRGSRMKRIPVQQVVPGPPANGLLVPELIPVARKVLEARATLIDGVAKLIEVVPVKACRFCSEVHIGSVGHQIATCTGPQCGARKSRHDWTNGSIDDIIDPMDVYHLADRVGRRIKHDHRFDVDRIPAVVELCIQAGIDIPDYPTKRRTKPVHMIGRKVVEFDDAEYLQEVENMAFNNLHLQHDESMVDKIEESTHRTSRDEETTVDASVRATRPDTCSSVSQSDCGNMTEEMPITSVGTSALADQTLRTYDAMRSGARKLMEKYPVKVCGYCPEVHVGPKGHSVKLCGAYKHQWRAGQHGWQQASIDDLIPPKYVWHAQDPHGPPLLNELRTYYGQTPAVVELCLQAGAALPERYRPMLRLDIVIPHRNELDKAA